MLNPNKCIFGVTSGKLLSFLVLHRGIGANPDKIQDIEETQPPHCLKEMQHLTGFMAALGRFISRFGNKALPFFKIMKRTGPFKWTPEAAAAFEELKRYLVSPPILDAPRPREPLRLYLAATPQTSSAALVSEKGGVTQRSTSHQESYSGSSSRGSLGASRGSLGASGGPLRASREDRKSVV